MNASEAERHLAALDRRSFLRLLGATAASGLLPAACSRAPAGLAPPPGVELRFLSPRTHAVLVAAAERVAGGGAGELVRRGAIHPGVRADAFLAGVPELAAPLEQALLVLEFGIYPLLAKLRPFTSLDAADRDAVLESLQESRWALMRTLFKGVKAVALLGVYAAPEARRLTGFPADYGAPGAGLAEAMAPFHRNAPGSV